jgi:hypothetical protein
MIDRGNCTFVTKVRNIEKVGAKMALICDNKPESSENVIMADDGSGSAINIPSFIIRKRDCDIIKAELNRQQDSKTVYVRAEIDIVHPDNRVDYEYWFSTYLDQDAWSVYDLSLYQRALEADALFTPRILTYSCRFCSDEIKKAQCLVDGDFCPYYKSATSPDSLQPAVMSQGLLYESLRQKCVHLETPLAWFTYTTRFLDNCVKLNDVSEECSRA